MPEYSPTPWSVDLSHDVPRIRDSANDSVAFVVRDANVHEKANARRIVASVNALEGVATDEIPAVMKKLRSALASYLEDDRLRPGR